MGSAQLLFCAFTVRNVLCRAFVADDRTILIAHRPYVNRDLQDTPVFVMHGRLKPLHGTHVFA
ncbi:MAG: hypothetical protein A4E58_01955 [Syntrophorhabdus sp. PtaB.Bin006]|nr:MAG: hypothetical protein A4E58_01955 [Syntrophorhabdus sp. PtaB.Bin006]